MMLQRKQQRPYAIVHDFSIPCDGLGDAHRGAQGDKSTAVRVALAHGAFEGDEGACSRGCVALPLLIENGLGHPGWGVYIVGAKGFS
jgi:hypothetical protein